MIPATPSHDDVQNVTEKRLRGADFVPMRKIGLLLALLVAIPVFAQEHPNSVFVFVTNPGGSWTSSDGTTFTGEVGAAFQRMLAPEWSVEAAIARRWDRSGFTTFDSGGNVIEHRIFTSHTTPVDLGGKYHFLTQSSWKPYAGVGVRWTDASSNSKLLGAAGGGVLWQFRPAVALRFDGKVYFGPKPAYLDTASVSVGVVWRF